MPTRNVVLTDHHENIIGTLVGSGRYQNASEVIREGLRLVEAREAIEALKLHALKEAARFGFADLNHSRFADVKDDRLEDFIDDLGRRATEQVRASER